MERFLNDENGFQNEYLVSYWALAHFFQNNFSSRWYYGTLLMIVESFEKQISQCKFLSSMDSNDSSRKFSFNHTRLQIITWKRVDACMIINLSNFLHSVFIGDRIICE